MKYFLVIFLCIQTNVSFAIEALDVLPLCSRKLCEKDIQKDIKSLCHVFHYSVPLTVDPKTSCACPCKYALEKGFPMIHREITLFKPISLIFLQAKLLRRSITTLRKIINKLDLDTLETMLSEMKQDFSQIQKMVTASNQGIAESWQEIYEYIDNVVKLNPSVDSKSNIHQQVETTLKLIESKSVSISKSLAQLEAKIYLETREMLNKASESERNYFLPQLDKIHKANQQLINH